MYFADPLCGRRRRALTRDQAVALWHDLGCELEKAKKDVANRTHGVLCSIRSLLSRRPAGIRLVEARVRSRVGRAVSHPHAITVLAAEGGRVVLSGPVLAYEVPYLLKCVRSAPGVKEVINRLDVHEEAGNISSLQGGVPRRPHSAFARERWTPALRVGAGAIGTAAVCTGVARGGPLGWARAFTGGALLARAAANTGFRETFGAGDGDGSLHVDKTIHILSPVEQVFAFWCDWENFPRFMTHLKEVRDLGNGRSHWVAAGPAGLSIPWDAEMTDRIENSLLAWRSVPGSLVRTSGRVRFEKDPDGGTRVSIRMSYTPPAGVLGHLVASLSGVDPKSEIDDDLVRLKSLLEIGKTRAHGSTVIFDPAGGVRNGQHQHAS